MILDGNEVTFSDVGSAHPLEEEYILAYALNEIIMIEAKKHGIEITNEEIRQQVLNKLPGYEEMEISEVIESMGKTDFVHEQAQRLQMSAEEFFLQYLTEREKKSLYTNHYIELQFGSIDSSTDIDEYVQQIHLHQEELLAEYKEKGRLVLVD